MLDKGKFILSKFAKPGLVFLFASNIASVLNYGYQYLSSFSLKNGQFSSLGSFISVIALVNAFLVAPLQADLVKVTKENSRGGEKISRKFVMSWLKVFLTASFISFMILLISLPFSDKIFGIESKLAFSFLILYTSLSFIGVLGKGIIQGFEKFLALSIIFLIEPFVRIIFAIVNSLTFKSLTFISFAPLVGLILTLIFGVVFVIKDSNGEDWDFDAKSHLINFYKKSKTTILSIALLSSFFSVNLIIAASVMDDHLADIYNKISLVGKTILFGSMPVTSVFYPKFISSKKENILLLLKKAIVITLGVAFLGTLPILIFPSFILGTVFNGLDSFFWESITFLAGSIILSGNNLLTYFSVATKKDRAVWPILIGLIIIIFSTVQFNSSLIRITQFYLLANIITFIGLIIVAFVKSQKTLEISYDTKS